MSSPDKILEIRDLTKIFGEVTVLDKVNFDLREGEIHGLCGENGAGKSTLLKCISGVYPSYEGEILLNGAPCSFADISESRKAGLAIIYQEMSLVSDVKGTTTDPEDCTWSEVPRQTVSDFFESLCAGDIERAVKVGLDAHVTQISPVGADVDGAVLLVDHHDQ